MAEARGPAWVKYVVDYAGLVAFAGAYAVTRDLIQASWGLGIGSALGLAVGLVVQRKVALLPLFTALTAIAFAGLAVIFKDAIFIKIKLTIIDGIFAIALIGGLMLGKQPLKAVLGEALTLTDATWTRLTWNYGLFFAVLAVINLFVWLANEQGLLTDGQFVLFRFPGVPILALIFSFAQVPLMMKDMKAQEDTEVIPPPPPAD